MHLIRKRVKWTNWLKMV